MSSDDIAISVRNLGKTYRLFGHPGDRIKQFLSLGMKKYHNEFTALQDVSFDIKKGETVGIIGRNGSGKSTLLQLICGILKPTTGTVKVNGRISALLELGAGFNPEFTGRENVYFQGAVMGICNEEMDTRFDEIAAFADIGEFIDQPVRMYSSGMFVRLAFSVAVHVAPDVLVVDEALGVGDSEFQERSFSRMRRMQQEGMTILLVSHSIGAVRNFCRRAIWLCRGSVIDVGDAGTVCSSYLAEIDNQRIGARGTVSADGVTSGLVVYPSGRTKQISIVRIEIDKQRIEVGGSLALDFELRFSSDFDPVTEFGLGVIFRDEKGALVAVLNTVRDDIWLAGDVRKVRLELTHAAFVPGRYWISVNVCDHQIMFAYDERNECSFFDVVSTTNLHGIPRWEGLLACEHAWKC